MAASQNSLKSTENPKTNPENSVIGYVHNLSPTKRNRSNTLDYATFTLQIDRDGKAQEALLYSPSKKALLEKSETSRTAVKLINHAYTEDEEKIVVNDTTFVGTLQATEYSFQYSELADRSKESVSILDVLNTHKVWDTVTVVGKVSQLKNPKTVGNPLKPLQVVEATFTDTTGSIPLDVFQEHIPKISAAKSYKLTNVQLKVWSGRKKICTTKRTTITEINDESLTTITVKQDDVEDPPSTALITEVTSVPRLERFLKCYKRFKKISQAGASKVAHCSKCGMIKANKCVNDLSATLEVIDDTGKQLLLKIGSEILKELLGEDVLPLDENSLGEKLLFAENFKVKYDAKSVVLNINHVDNDKQRTETSI